MILYVKTLFAPIRPVRSPFSVHDSLNNMKNSINVVSKLGTVATFPGKLISTGC